MIDYDSDEVSSEFLIQHLPLADVLAFIHARDEVRRIRTLLPESAPEPCETPTLPAIGYVEPARRAVVVDDSVRTPVAA